jgi:hypothetical protein
MIRASLRFMVEARISVKGGLWVIFSSRAMANAILGLEL